MSDPVDNQKKAVGDRLKQARSAFEVTQKEFCASIGMPLPSLRDYELGKRIPGGDAVALLVRAGINANWLLTGEGPMLLADLVPPAAEVPPPDRSPRINVDALVQAFCVSVQTAKPGETIAQSAHRAVAFYKYCWDQGLITEDGEGEGNLQHTA